MSDTTTETSSVSDKYQEYQERLRQLQSEAEKLTEVNKPSSPAAARQPSVTPSPKPQISWAQKEEVDSRSIFVGNLGPATTSAELEDHFSACGNIERVTLPVNPMRQPKGFAYIEFSEKSQAEAALALNDSIIKDNGRQIAVVAKRTNLPNMSRGRGRGRGRGRRFRGRF
ncbi:hypothetical protein GEMRC1_012058 [Eukaryota sp. GEM-RC1]